MKRCRRIPEKEFDMGTEPFRLVSESGIDPERVARERAEAREAQKAREEFERQSQLTIL